METAHPSAPIKMRLTKKQVRQITADVSVWHLAIGICTSECPLSEVKQISDIPKCPLMT